MTLVATRINDYVAASPNLDSWVQRASVYGALDVALQARNDPMSVVSENLFNTSLGAVGQDVTVPVMNEHSVTITNTRPATVSDDENTSALVTLTYVIYQYGFTSVPSAFQNNFLTAQEDFNHRFGAWRIAVMKDLDTAVLAALSTNKNQVSPDLLGGKYSWASNTVTAALAEEEELIGDLTVLMNSNDYDGPQFKVIGNTGLHSILRKISEHGLQNDENKVLRLLDKDFFFTNRLSNAANKKASGYILQPGSVGMVFRREREALVNRTSQTGHKWEPSVLPGTEIPMDIYSYPSVGDYNAIHGAGTADLTRGYKENFSFCIEAAIVTAYNDAIATNAAPFQFFNVADA